MLATIALADMRPNLVIAALLLAAGVAYVLFLARHDRGGSQSARWVPWASLVVGPLAGLVFCAIDVFILNSAHYPLPGDSIALLGPVLLIGTFAGCVWALVFGAALHMRRRRGD